ncbi:MAG: hypothetical protein JJU11_04470 [Candidatus Sumerlaeia bacterium]|nr:hypothetical protein [Candidatus Sumerlaeia bacterium]
MASPNLMGHGSLEGVGSMVRWNIALLCLVAGLAFAHGNDGLASPVEWIGGSGDWSDGSNWSGGMVPVDGAEIEVFGEESVTIRIDGTVRFARITSAVPTVLLMEEATSRIVASPGGTTISGLVRLEMSNGVLEGAEVLSDPLTRIIVESQGSVVSGGRLLNGFKVAESGHVLFRPRIGGGMPGLVVERRELVISGTLEQEGGETLFLGPEFVIVNESGTLMLRDGAIWRTDPSQPVGLMRFMQLRGSLVVDTETANPVVMENFSLRLYAGSLEVREGSGINMHARPDIGTWGPLLTSPLDSTATIDLASGAVLRIENAKAIVYPAIDGMEGILELVGTNMDVHRGGNVGKLSLDGRSVLNLFSDMVVHESAVLGPLQGTAGVFERNLPGHLVIAEGAHLHGFAARVWRQMNLDIHGKARLMMQTQTSASRSTWLRVREGAEVDLVEDLYEFFNGDINLGRIVNEGTLNILGKLKRARKRVLRLSEMSSSGGLYMRGNWDISMSFGFTDFIIGELQGPTSRSAELTFRESAIVLTGEEETILHHANLTMEGGRILVESPFARIENLYYLSNSYNQMDIRVPGGSVLEIKESLSGEQVALFGGGELVIPEGGRMDTSRFILRGGSLENKGNLTIVDSVAPFGSGLRPRVDVEGESSKIHNHATGRMTFSGVSRSLSNINNTIEDPQLLLLNEGEIYFLPKEPVIPNIVEVLAIPVENRGTMNLHPDVRVELNILEAGPESIITGSGHIRQVVYPHNLRNTPFEKRLVNSGLIHPRDDHHATMIFTALEEMESTAEAVYKFSLHGPDDPRTSRLAIIGRFGKNGTLQVGFDQGYEPNGGEVYPLVSFTSHVGDFLDVELPQLPDDLRGWIDSSPVDVVYSVEGAALQLEMNNLPQEMPLGRLYPLFIRVTNRDTIMARNVVLDLGLTGGLVRTNILVNPALGDLAPGESAECIIVVRADRFGPASFTAAARHNRHHTISTDWSKSTSTTIFGSGMGRSDLLVVH